MTNAPRMLKRLLVAGACAAALAAMPATANAKDETATSGPVSATFSYTELADSQGFSNLALTITRGGVPALDTPISSEFCGDLCWPGGFGDRSSVTIRDLDSDGEPEVLLDLFSGGAHCCFETQIFRFDSAGLAGAAPQYTRAVDHTWLDSDYDITDIGRDGSLELRSTDARFAYVLSSFAGSAFPIQIFRYSAGELADVTGEFRSLVRADAARHWKRYRKYIGRRAPFNDPGRGSLAAWVADQYTLGQGAKARKELSRARSRGWVTAKEVKALNQLLTETGYRQLSALG